MYYRTPLILAALVLLVNAIGACRGESIQLNSTMFGHLDQALVTSCTSDTGINNSCGATSVVNSFTYLENAYPQIYGNHLIPLIPGNSLIEDEVAVADNLACMQTCSGERWRDDDK